MLYNPRAYKRTFRRRLFHAEKAGLSAAPAYFPATGLRLRGRVKLYFRTRICFRCVAVGVASSLVFVPEDARTSSLYDDIARPRGITLLRLFHVIVELVNFYEREPRGRNHLGALRPVHLELRSGALTL